MGPHPAVAAVRSAVRADLADLTTGQLVLVACSGGPDSLALAQATAFVAPRLGLRAGAVVVDHALQAGSAEVARDAATRCRELGLEPVRVVEVDVGSRGGGPEAAARDARYAALERVAATEGAAAVLLGHTLDDQAETVLLGLARGSGARSLSGMAARRGLLRRPLLELTRAQTRAACAATGLQAWTDPTNTDPTLTRSRVRGSLLPQLESALGPGVAAALARTARLLRADADLLDDLAGELLERTWMGSRVDGVELDIVALAAAPDALRWRALRVAAIRAGAPPGALSSRHVWELDRLVTGWHGQGPLDLPGHVTAVRACGRLSMAPADRTEPPQQE